MHAVALSPAESVDPISTAASELVILGFLLAGGSTAELVVPLEPDDFVTVANRAIWNAVVALERQGGAVDFDMVLQQVASNGDGYLFASVGGLEWYLRGCCDHLVVCETLPYHARRIAGKGDLRRLRLALAKLQSRLGDADVSPDDLIAETEALVLSLPSRKRATAIESLKQVSRQVIREMEASLEGDQQKGLATGFAEVDDMTGGLQPADYFVVAARPSMGKTAFAVQVADAVADHDAALVFEFEMPSVALVKRLLAAKSSVPSEEFRPGHKVSGSTISRITSRAAAMLEKSSLSFCSRAAMRISELRSVARRWRLQNQSKRGLIVVDYLQLVRPDRDSRDPNEARDVGEVSKGLKAMAVELNVTVMALAQLNRDLERRTNKRPMMSDLRSSGQIEQDADLIAFLYRDEYYNPQTSEKGIAEVIIGKARNGATGTVKLAWKPIYTRFDSLAGQQDSADWRDR